jgi:hypothetical protein
LGLGELSEPVDLSWLEGRGREEGGKRYGRGTGGRRQESLTKLSCMLLNNTINFFALPSPLTEVTTSDCPSLSTVEDRAW